MAEVSEPGKNPRNLGPGLSSVPALDAPSAPRRRRLPWLRIILAVLVFLAGIYWITHRSGARSPNAAAGGNRAGRGPQGPVRVMIGQVETKDVPVYLDGLGTVQAFNTVTVRSRVEGQLQKLAFEEGKDVKQGELLAQIDPSPFETQVRQASARKAQDEALRQNAEVDLKRNQSLLASKIVSQEVYDAAQAQVKQLDAAVSADQAAIDNATVQLAYTRITAPISGRAGLRMVDEGNVIRTGDSNGIVVLTQLKPISVVFTLPEQAIPQIQAQGNPEGMEVLAVARDNKTIISRGKLAVVDNQIDANTGTIRLKATFPNEDLKLWPGQFVNTRLLLTVRKDGVVVPASVVQRGPDGAYAFVVNDDMSVKISPLQVAFVEADQAVIDQGLRQGEKVVLDGQYKLQPGSKVQPAEAAAPSGRPGIPAATAKGDKKGKGKTAKAGAGG